MTDAWGIPGWSAQNPVYPDEGTTVLPVPLPANVSLTRVTATYFNGDQPVNGLVRFVPSTNRVFDGTTSVMLREVKAHVVNGLLVVDLFPNDDADVTPGFVWNVIETFPGGSRFSVSVPSTEDATPVDLFSLPRSDHFSQQNPILYVKGDKGDPGLGVGQVYHQTDPVSHVIIPHSYGRRPVVTVYVGNEAAETDILATDTNVTVDFANPTSDVTVILT